MDTQTAHAGEPDYPALILFDGVCNLCDKSVRLIFRNDPSARFRFAPLQSELARQRLTTAGRTLPGGDPDSIILLDSGNVYERSDAALRIARRMRFPWPILWAGIVLPRPIRDGVYKWIARNRYRWFGKKDVCMLPPAGLAKRFAATSDSE